MGRKFVQYLLFAGTIAAIVLFLQIMNWIPGIMQQDSMRAYSNIDLIKTKLQIKEVYVPSYFPKQFRWPPSEILAQRAPYEAVIMEFRDERTGETILMTSQTAKGRRPAWEKKIVIQKIKEQVPYQFKGRDAQLTVGQCSSGDSCSGISWDEGNYQIDVLMKSGPFDLIRIAESMIHQTVQGEVKP